MFDGLDVYQSATLKRTQELIELRNQNLALLFGDTEIVEESSSHLVVERSYFNNKVLSIFNTSDQPLSLEIPEGGILNFFGNIDEGMLELPPASFEIITYN